MWGLTPTRVSQIAKDPRRKPLYDAALWGLPQKRLAGAIAEKRRRLAGIHSLKTKRPSQTAPSAADVWDELVMPGATFVVNTEQGDHLPEGCEGKVVERSTRAGKACVTIRFSTGYSESFDLAYLQDPASFLTATGR